MHVQKIIILSLFLCLPRIASSQQQLKLQNQAGEPIAFAHVLLKGQKGQLLKGLSNDQGLFMIEGLQLPISLQVQHLAYKLWTGQITTPKPFTVTLEAQTTQLDELVVTGQYLPQADELAIHKIRVVNKERIEALGSNQIEDILRQELNIRFTQDMALGTANLSLQGLDGQSVKVLIDGTPIGGRQGSSNEIDLNQINPQMIERIEIIEGPMAVSYGADALAGVINIITKKSVKNQFEAGMTWQEGSVGNEYGKQQGIRDIGLNLGGTLGKNLSAKANARHYDFHGWQGNATGRAKQWLPKEQLFLGGLIRYAKPKWDVYYRIDYLDEALTDFDEAFEEEAGKLVAYDDEYLVDRWMHQLQSTYSPNARSKIHTLLSFTDYTRLSRDVIASPSGDKRLVIGSEAETWYKSWNFRTTASKQTINQWLSGEIGIDVNTERGGGFRVLNHEQHWHDLALFASSEISPTQSLSIRPGLRWAKNSNYKAPLTPSIRLRHKLGKITSRLALAKGFRAPSIRELHFFFKDSNHDIVGNPNLEAEHSINISAQFELSQLSLAKGDFEVSSDVFFNDVKDKIALASLANSSSFTYLNIDRFKTLGLRLQSGWNHKKWRAQAGFVYTGSYNRYADLETNVTATKSFYYYPELNLSLSYHLEKQGLSLHGFYKYYGKLPTPQLNEEGNPYIAHIDPYHWMDMTVQKQLFKKSTSLTFGIKNLFNIQQINNSITSSGNAHGLAGGSSAVGYGRSYFLRLAYRLHYSKS